MVLFLLGLQEHETLGERIMLVLINLGKEPKLLAAIPQSLNFLVFLQFH